MMSLQVVSKTLLACLNWYVNDWAVVNADFVHKVGSVAVVRRIAPRQKRVVTADLLGEPLGCFPASLVDRRSPDSYKFIIDGMTNVSSPSETEGSSGHGGEL